MCDIAALYELLIIDGSTINAFGLSGSLSVFQSAFECPICGKSYSASFNLRRHVRHTHMQQKDHVCPFCGQKFSRKGHMEQHLTKHPEQAVPCKFCPRLFATAEDQFAHFNKMHFHPS